MISVPAAFGIVVTCLVLFLGATISSTWWAAGISKQLEMVIRQTGDQTISHAALMVRVSVLEAWKAQMESSGTPILAKRLEDQAKTLNDLRRDFDIYKATESKKP